MRTGRGAVFALALLPAAGARAAGPAPFRGRDPVVAVSLSPSLTTGYDQLDVFFLSGDTSTTPRFAVRDTSYVDDQVRSVRWADSAACPAVLAQLRDLRFIEVRFTPPFPLDRPRTTGLPMPQTPGPLHGEYVTLTGPGSTAQGSGRGRLTVSSNQGPWVAWGSALATALKPCWSGTEAAVTTGG